MATEYRYYAKQIAIINDGKLIIYDIGKTIDKAIEDKSTSRIEDIENTIGDSTLNTTDKTLTGAINEVREFATKAYHFKRTITLADLMMSPLELEGSEEGDIYNISDNNNTVASEGEINPIKIGDNIVFTGNINTDYENQEWFYDDVNKFIYIFGYEFDILSGVFDTSAIEAEIGTKAASADVGTLSNLGTTNKSSIVNAINEVNVKLHPIVKAELTSPIIVNTIYNLGIQSAISITLPEGAIGDFIQFDFISKDTATSLTISPSDGFIGYDLIPDINTIYSLYFDYGVIGYDENEDMLYGWRFNYSEYVIDSN